MVQCFRKALAERIGGFRISRDLGLWPAVQCFRILAGGDVLGTPVVPFCPFNFGVSLLKLNSRKKGTLIINGLLGNLVLGLQE